MRDPLMPIGLDPEIDRRLCNWGRWARTARHSQVSMTAIVISRMFPAPSCWDEPKTSIAVDMGDAWAVEDAWVRAGNDRAKIITRGHYVLMVDYRDIARALGFSFRRWDEELSRSARVVASCITASPLSDRDARADRLAGLLAEVIADLPRRGAQLARGSYRHA